MTKIKICGLSRPCDIEYVNEALPDFAGFVINVPKSRRNVSVRQLERLRQQLDDAIVPVGVFVNEKPEVVADLLNRNLISAAQLHGHEDEAYLAEMRQRTDGLLIQAFSVHTKQDIETAVKSSADLILLDNGPGGTGERFDWTLLKEIPRRWFLAGGIASGNIPEAIRTCAPYALDLSSGVETNGFKDREKILKVIELTRKGLV